MYFFPSNVSYPESISVESNAIMPGTQAKHTGVIIDFSICNLYQPTNPNRVIKFLGLPGIEGFTERIFRVKTRTIAGKVRQLFILDGLLPIMSLRSFPTKLSLTHPIPNVSGLLAFCQACQILFHLKASVLAALLPGMLF